MLGSYSPETAEKRSLVSCFSISLRLRPSPEESSSVLEEDSFPSALSSAIDPAVDGSRAMVNVREGRPCSSGPCPPRSRRLT